MSGINSELLLIINYLVHSNGMVKDELCRTRKDSKIDCSNVHCGYCPLFTFSDLKKDYLSKIIHTNQHLRVISIGSPILMSR